jgi:hypothetical protein
MTRAKRTAVFVLCLSMALVVGLEASARTETLRWTHPGADGYRVHYGTETGVYTSHIDVEIPATDPGEAHAVFVYDLDVPDTETVYVAVTAYAEGLESIPSNEQKRSPSEGTIGKPGRPMLVLR